MKKKTKIALALLAALLLGGGVLTAVRWEAWFGNPPEETYQPPSTPHRLLLTFGNDGPLSRRVSWQCDTALQPSALELLDSTMFETQASAIKATGEVFTSRNGKAAYYSAEVRHVVPGHVYRYRVRTGRHVSSWHQFTVPTGDATQTGNFSFLYFGDVQDTLGGITHRLVAKACAEHPEAEFVVFGGDLTERPTDAYWAETFRALDGIGQTLPILNVAGNHEYLKHPIRQLERRFSLVFSYFLQSKVGANHVYTLPYHDAQLYLLDSNRELPFLLTQRDWLRKQLATSNARWNIVVLHHPIYSVKSTSNNAMQRLVFADLFNDNVDLVLQGHEHAYARMTRRDEAQKPIPPLYTISHCSPKNYRIEFNERFDRFGVGQRHYQHIAIHGDTLSMRTYEAESGKIYDAVDIVKGEHDRPVIHDRAQHLPESLIFRPQRGNKKDAAFAQRIRDYQQRKNSARP